MSGRLRSALARLVPASPATEEELRAMRIAAWRKQGMVTIRLAELGEMDRLYVEAIFRRQIGLEARDG